MKKLFVFLALAVWASSSAHAQVDVLFSTSDTDMNAGTTLDVILGESGSMYLWVINNDAAAIDGLGLDVLSSNAAALEATAHNIANPTNPNRWAATAEGDLGDLVLNSNAFALIGFGSDGIANDGVGVFHSQVVFTATELGTTDLSVAENSNLISVTGNAPNSVNFGTGTVNVVPIPEPGSLMAGVFGLGLLYSRRRKA